MTPAPRRFIFSLPVFWMPMLLATTGLGLYCLLSVLPAASPSHTPEVLEARQRLQLYLNDYATQLDSYQVALQTGNGTNLARADAFLNNQRQEFAPVLENYLSLLATLPPDNEPLVVKLQSLAPDARFQFTCTALGSQGQLIQASVTENEADVRHLALWQAQGHILALNNYETEWQAQLTALRVIKTPDTRFVIANGTTRQLEDSAPFIKVYQQLESDFKFIDKTHTYVPNELLEVFGSSEFIGESANLKMDTLLLDPARIMAACDSCGLVSTRALWQWAGSTGYQRVDQQILNDPNNALYSALAVLVRQESAPAWTQSFLTAGARSALKKLDRFDPNRYPAIEQGLLVADTQSWQQGYQYTITGPILLTVQVQPDPQGHWQVVGIVNPRIQKPGWFNHHPLAG